MDDEALPHLPTAATVHIITLDYYWMRLQWKNNLSLGDTTYDFKDNNALLFVLCSHFAFGPLVTRFLLKFETQKRFINFIINIYQQSQQINFEKKFLFV